MSGRLAWLLPAIPALMAAAQLLCGNRLPGRGRTLAILSAAGPMAVAFAIWFPGDLVETTGPLVPGIGVTLGTGYDALAAVITFVVSTVALCVQVFSTTHLRDDPRYPSYAAMVALFTAAMLLVVVSGDLLVLLVGWEVMGFCSYVLIGHDTGSPVAAKAAVTAFLTTRFADLFFTAGLFVLGVGAGSFRIGDVLAAAGSGRAGGAGLSHAAVVTGGLLVVVGALGKSAQFPLQTWLPDAMAGPTPVSALIHAATMVAAGVYLLARLYPLLAASAITLDVLAVVSAVTMLLGALAALAQDDLKRVLAWSTVSQLAYMYGALAVGGVSAGVFHLVSHAAFKALLFLAAGSVIHVVGSTDLSLMGGLRRRLPWTFAAMTIGLAALAGLPPFSGFVSKDAILAVAYGAAQGEGPIPVGRGFAWLVWLSGLITAGVTVAYCLRLWLRLFAGVARGERDGGEPAWAERGPVVVLAAGVSVIGGLGLERHGTFDRYVGALAAPGLGLSALQSGLALLLAAVALVTVFAIWRRAPAADPAKPLLRRAGPPLAAGLNMDVLYLTAFLRPVRDRLAPAVAELDRRLLDGAVEGSGQLTTALGSALRRVENGNVQAYATGLAVGAVALAVAVAVGVGR